jgi:DNA-binding LytR/AlgR family response regulator
MPEIKIAVVEDEIIIADSICDTLNELGYIALEPAVTYTEALKTIEKHNPDLAILDIQLSGKKDGIELAWKIKEDYDIPFIFLTSNADKLTVERAKRVAPPAYLVKPFNRDELFTAIEIAIFNHAKANAEMDDTAVIKDAIFIKQKSVFQKVLFSDILVIKSDHVYLELIMANDKVVVVRDSLNEFIKRLTNRFFRVHRGYIINLDHLTGIDNHIVVIGGKYEIPIGKNYRDKLFHQVRIA